MKLSWSLLRYVLCNAGISSPHRADSAFVEPWQIIEESGDKVKECHS